MKYNDPTGHKACESTQDCNNPIKTVFTKTDYLSMLGGEFGWSVRGDDWVYSEVKKIYEVANKVLDYADNVLKDGAGLRWMDKYLGDVKLHHNPIENLFPNNFVPEGNTVYLLSDWINDPRGPENVFAHELGHVVDNRSAHSSAVWSGGGFGDKLAVKMGASQAGLNYTFPRFINGSGGISPANAWSIVDPNKPNYNWALYGNNSTPDYFAHAFSFAMYNPNAAPAGVVDAMNKIIFGNY